jgi:DNA mismatch endonuclease (patch repair protein)
LSISTNNMADVFSQRTRSWLMSRIRQRDTEPEITARKFLHLHGYRFRLHARNLPGTPDIVLPRPRVVIFVNGCFWHHHARCRRASMPTSNRSFWETKIGKNIARDKQARRRLHSLGWSVITLWQCQLSSREKRDACLARLIRRLESK